MPSTQREQYARQQEYIQEIRQVRHDLRQHLRLIQAYLSTGDRDVLEACEGQGSPGIRAAANNTGPHAKLQGTAPISSFDWYTLGTTTSTMTTLASKLLRLIQIVRKPQGRKLRLQLFQ